MPAPDLSEDREEKAEMQPQSLRSETGKRSQEALASRQRKGDLDSAVRSWGGTLDHRIKPLEASNLAEVCEMRSGTGERADGGGQGHWGWSPRELNDREPE